MDDEYNFNSIRVGKSRLYLDPGISGILPETPITLCYDLKRALRLYLMMTGTIIYKTLTTGSAAVKVFYLCY